MRKPKKSSSRKAARPSTKPQRRSAAKKAQPASKSVKRTPIEIRLGGYGPATTGFSKGLRLIGDRMEAEFGADVKVRYVYNIMGLGYKAEDNPEATRTVIAIVPTTLKRRRSPAL